MQIDPLELFSEFQMRFADLDRHLGTQANHPGFRCTELEEILVDLYRLGLKLSPFEASSPQSPTSSTRPMDSSILHAIEKKLAAYPAMSKIDFYEDSCQSSMIDMIDDLADLYRDLSVLDSVPANADESAKRSVLSDLAFTFRVHWGAHCRNALNYCWLVGEVRQS